MTTDSAPVNGVIECDFIDTEWPAGHYEGSELRRGDEQPDADWPAAQVLVGVRVRAAALVSISSHK